MTQYDDIGDDYRAYKTARAPVPEEHTFRRALGSVDGARVLDLACGYGYYTRLAHSLGARSVTGVDVSATMVSIGEQLEREQQAGIRYQVHDAATMPVVGSFDLVTAVWLLNYATSADNVTAMFEAVRGNLTDEGSFVGVTIAPWFDPWGPSWAPYGMAVRKAEARSDHDRLVVELLAGRGTRLHFSRWNEDVYQRASKTAGFETFDWFPLEVPERLLAKKGEAYWRDYLENPFIGTFRARP